MRQRQDLTGKKYGKLVAVQLINDTKRPRHLWHCDCGIEKEILTYNVTSGHVVSCGCYLRENAAKQASIRNRKPDGVAAFNHIYRSYKSRAANRKQEFLLTTEQFRDIITRNCHYCKIEPLQEFSVYKAKDSGTFLYNGVDRINSKIGYRIDNVVPCCWICNRAKGELSTEEFLAWSKRLYECQTNKYNT